MINPLRMYGEGLLTGANPCLHLMDDTVMAVDLQRFLAPADAIDEQLLHGLRGPVLDVGCGPGRHLHALAARGVFALGVDLSPVAVDLAVGRGGQAIVGDIFDELPNRGWQSALLLDGNIGIGGDPVRLLTRIADLLVPSGSLLVELGPPGTPTGGTFARLESVNSASAWFAWARVAASSIGPIAQAGGFRVRRLWSLNGRWFGRLRAIDRARDRRSQPRHGPA